MVIVWYYLINKILYYNYKINKKCKGGKYVIYFYNKKLISY